MRVPCPRYNATIPYEEMGVKTTLETISETKRTIRVEIPADVVEKKLEELYRRVARTIEIPGFRRGRVPRSFLEARFGKDFLYEDSQEELIEEYLPKALEEHGLQPAGRPETRVVEFEAGKPFIFEVDLEVFPEVELPDYETVEVEEPPAPEVPDPDVEAVIQELRVQHATLVPKGEDEPVAPEDVAVLRLESGKTHEVQARAEGWSAPLVGKKPGERVELESPRGEKVTGTVEAVKRIELPDLEELATTLGHESPQELREEIRKELEERAERDRKRALRTAVLDALVEKSRVLVPEALVKRIAEAERSFLQQRGHEVSAEEFASLQESVRQRIARDRVLEAVKEKENLALSDEEFETFLKEEAERRNLNPVKFKALLEREGELERLRDQKEEERVLEFLLDRVRVRKPQRSGSPSNSSSNSSDENRDRDSDKDGDKAKAEDGGEG